MKLKQRRWSFRHGAILSSPAISAVFFAASVSAQGLIDVVEKIDDSGHIFLEGHEEALELWGLRLTDIEMLEALAVGHSIRCVFVTETAENQLVDCSVESDREFFWPKDYLNLYAWLPAIGAATYDCPEHHRPPDERKFSNRQPSLLRGSFNVGPMGYSCTDAGLPIRALPMIQ